MARNKTRRDQTKPVGSTISFRVPDEVAEFLDKVAQDRKDGLSKPSHHKEARRIFAHGLKQLYGIEIA